ncbi:hypothetical protein A7D00_1105 [Trichophyton violaceum]|uniref:Uncharacterized protein n=1 Tax=Trichophyton violaceum TaxID=34388 RepID=A0A178FUB9_TRIVO|nr:hypothetical protein A7D00_1105 [Trichophyton violaceum]
MVGGDFLIVNLSERHLRKPKSPDELVEYCQFRVLADEAHAEHAMCMRSTYLLSSSVLRCGHICADSSWSEAALGWLHDIELAELYKIEPNMRPPVVNAALRASLAPKKHWLDRAKAFVTREWEKPDTCNYADHLIPELYKRWKQPHRIEEANS